MLLCLLWQFLRISSARQEPVHNLQRPQKEVLSPRTGAAWASRRAPRRSGRGARESKLEPCTDLCNGVCTSPCCTQFALFQAFCQDDIRNHLLTPWSDCSETCLDRMEAMFIETQPGVSCHPIWSNTLTVGTEYVTEEFPHGQHALYEEFLGKCQGQRRRRHMHEHVTQNAIYHTAGDDYVVDPESEIVLNARHPDAPVAIGKVDPQFGLKLDVAGETKARGAELLSLNGWNSTKLSQAKNLGARAPSPAPAAFPGFARRRDRQLICACAQQRTCAAATWTRCGSRRSAGAWWTRGCWTAAAPSAGRSTARATASASA